MEMNIGTNIKRLRLSKGITQEQLADLLSVSSAAVSKWEAKSTYPDITLLFPLAEIFGVSIDELLGYDEAKAKADIDAILAKYQDLGVSGDYSAREKLIKQARKKYPHDFDIMVAYMWDLAGGSAGNDAAILLKNKAELLQLCNCILENCVNDDSRASAMNLKAKLLHAEGKTDEALELLSSLPSQPSQFMKEQLFGKATAEYRYWNRKNCYGLINVMAIKHARIVRFDPKLSVAEKVTRLDRMAQTYAVAGEQKESEFFCVGEEAVLSIAAGMLTADNTLIQEVIRLRKRQFNAMRKMMCLAEKDPVLKELIASKYKTDDILAWGVTRLLESPHQQFAKLRENPEYMQMLKEYCKVAE